MTFREVLTFEEISKRFKEAKEVESNKGGLKTKWVNLLTTIISPPNKNHHNCEERQNERQSTCIGRSSRGTTRRFRECRSWRAIQQFVMYVLKISKHLKSL